MSGTFERKEMKYLITEEQKVELCKVINKYMKADEFGKSLVKNIYYDTPDSELIRRSIEKPVFKEKFRIRAYGNEVNENSGVFLELKKKYNGIVYKRRVKLSEKNAMDFMDEEKYLRYDDQILNEISYFKKVYSGLRPAVYLSYIREAYFGIEDKNLRITLDQDILIRDYDLSLKADAYGNRIIPKGKMILEVKTLYGLPNWLIEFFEENDIYKTSFSKYGTGYKLLKGLEEKGGKEDVA